MPVGRLTGAACYLAGPMTAATVEGMSQWREDFEEALTPMGVVILNPVNKQIEIGQEGVEERKSLEHIRATRDIDAIRGFMQPIRRVDLRCVDLASFIIVRYDGSDTFGTHEEVVLGVREQKPVLILLENGMRIENINPWLFAQVTNNDHIFEDRWELVYYLEQIHYSVDHPTDRRWMLFDFAKLYGDALEAAQCI